LLTSKSEEKAKPVKEAFPQIKIALGGLDDSKLLEKEAAKADIVIRTLKILSNLIAMLI
jgi:hypothetical protein